MAAAASGSAEELKATDSYSGKDEESKPKPMSALTSKGVIVMRHGIRQDQHPSDDIVWDTELTRPFDPPLSDIELPGKIYTTEMDGAEISHFIVSPLLRTLQTAAYVALASKNKCREFRIDDRICEDEPAMRRCILRVQKIAEFDASKGHCKSLEEAAFLSVDEAKAVIEGIIGEPCTVILNWPGIAASSPPSDSDPSSAADSGGSSGEVSPSVRRKPVFGKHLSVLEGALKERKNDKSKEMQHAMIVSHGSIVGDCVSAKSGGVLIDPMECAWVAFDEREVLDVYSPSRISIIFDPRLPS